MSKENCVLFIREYYTALYENLINWLINRFRSLFQKFNLSLEVAACLVVASLLEEDRWVALVAGIAVDLLKEAFVEEVDLLLVLHVLPLGEPFPVEASMEALFLLMALRHLVHPSCPLLYLALLVLVVVPSFEVAFPSASAPLSPSVPPYPLVVEASAASGPCPHQLFDALGSVVPQHSS